MFRRRRSTYDRTYSLQSYGPGGTASPAALAAAASAGSVSRSNSMTSSLSSAAAATALRRHNSLTSESLGALQRLDNTSDRRGSNIPRTRTMTHVEGSGRSMSMTTTTIKQLGSFQLISTKTTPLAPPGGGLRPPRRPGYAASHASFESDLNPVFEETEMMFERPTAASPVGGGAARRGRGSVAFSAVQEADEDRIAIRHVPNRSVSPMKSALKPDNSLSPSVSISSQTTEEAALRRKRSHRVSFTQDHEEFLIPDYSEPAMNDPQMAAKRASMVVSMQKNTHQQQQLRHERVTRGAPATAAAAAAAAGPLTNGRLGRNHEEDSDSGNSVYSDAFEEFEPGKGTRKPRRSHATSTPKSKMPNGRSSGTRAESKQHHYASLATGGIDESQLHSKAQQTTTPALNDVLAYKYEEPAHPTLMETLDRREVMNDDDSDAFSLRSDSSWKRDLSETSKKPAFKLSLRDEARLKGPVSPELSTQLISKSSPARGPMQYPLSQEQRYVNGRPLQMPPQLPVPRTGGFKLHSLRSEIQRPNPADLLAPDPPTIGRRGSVGSLDRVNSQVGGGFKMTLRDEVASKKSKKQSANSGSFMANGFRSRFADSDSEDDLIVPPLSHPELPEPLGVQATRANKLMHVFSPFNTTKVLVHRKSGAPEGVSVSRQKTSTRKTSKSWLRRNEEPAPVFIVNDIEVVDKFSAAAAPKKKRFQGLRRVFGLN